MKLTTIVIGNPSLRCGVYSTAKIHAQAISATFTTDVESILSVEDAIIYIHWHPNFLFQHPNWSAALDRLANRRKCFLLHDYAFMIPARREDDICVVFNESAKTRRGDFVIQMPLLDPYPYKPTTEGDPDKVGLFGFFGPWKGFWEIAVYAKEHKRKARFVTTVHPFALDNVKFEFNEFRLFCKRNGFEIIDEWLVEQELADTLGECGFFAVPRRVGIGSSGSITSMLAVQRPVFAVDSQFLGEASKFTMPFRFEKWPNRRDLEEGIALALQAQEALAPEKIFGELHNKVVGLLCSETN